MVVVCRSSGGVQRGDDRGGPCRVRIPLHLQRQSAFHVRAHRQPDACALRHHPGHAGRRDAGPSRVHGACRLGLQLGLHSGDGSEPAGGLRQSGGMGVRLGAVAHLQRQHVCRGALLALFVHPVEEHRSGSGSAAASLARWLVVGVRDELRSQRLHPLSGGLVLVLHRAVQREDSLYGLLAVAPCRGGRHGATAPLSFYGQPGPPQSRIGHSGLPGTSRGKTPNTTAKRVAYSKCRIFMVLPPIENGTKGN